MSGLGLRKDAVGKGTLKRGVGGLCGKRAQWGGGLIRGLSGACVEGLSGGGSGRW